MWTARERVRHLRNRRAAILREWQANAQKSLWHLDKGFFGRKGVVFICASETLNALIAFYQAQLAQTANETLRNSSPVSIMSEEDSTFTVETALEDDLLGAETEVPKVKAEIVLPPRPQQWDCARAWGALEIEWPDVRELLRLLAATTESVLREREADEETLMQFALLFDSLVAGVAAQRIEKTEEHLVVLREEALVTQQMTTRFLATASHDLRTPLTAILGFAELLQEENYGPLTPEQQTPIGHIENSAQNLLESINNFLDLLTIRIGKFTPHYRLVNIHSLLKNLYDILLPLAKRKNVVFTLNLPETLRPIETDESVVRHSVYHLLASALRATPQGGEVTLTAQREGHRLAIVTYDTALHLPQEAAENMKNPYSRLENSPTRGYDGFEVGLPLVQRYLEMLGGDMEIESQPQRGTTFRILLPIAHSEKAASAAP